MRKIDAARRQLLAAIHLHWFTNEPTAPFVLATNAWEVCDALLQRTDRLRILEEVSQTHGSSAEEIRRLVSKPRNFLKHADRDPDDELPEIDFHDCNSVILSAAVDYLSISGRSPFSFGLFIAWYAAIYPPKTGEFFRREANVLFPGLASQSASEQIEAARRESIRALPRSALWDRRNELTDNWRWLKFRRLNQDGITAEL